MPDLHSDKFFHKRILRDRYTETKYKLSFKDGKEKTLKKLVPGIKN